jgi:eukaryotic-like serine/threonine-protein kinase
MSIKKFFGFIFSKVFILNVIISIGLVVLVFGFTYKWLDSYTRHGTSVSVPDLRGMTIEKLEEFLKYKSLSYKVADSTLYSLDYPPGTVIDQEPDVNEKVKEDRTIYVTITRTIPPGVKIPNLLDNSLRQAELILKSYGLTVGDLIYKPDLAKNAVLQMRVNGLNVQPGDEVTKGTVIDLVLGDGFGNTKVLIPDLFNLKYDEAKFVIKASSLNIGNVVFDNTVLDSSKARVFRQQPVFDDGKVINQGESLDLFLTESEDIIRLHNLNDDNNNYDANSE